jgi:calcium-translocating P-type ATPase
MVETNSSAWHALTPAEALARLEVDQAAGLAASEARRRRETFGANEVSARSGPPVWLRFLKQFHQAVMYILLVAAGASFVLNEVVDGFVILTVVLINGIVGFIQESKAEKAIGALSKMMLTMATVRRDGQKTRVPSADLVPGDMVLLQSGDRVPADLRLVQVKNLQCDESALTGESVPAVKAAAALPAATVLNDRVNLAFAGSLVTYGQAEGVVVATGNRSETGRIAAMIAGAVDLSTPLTRKLQQFTRALVVIIIVMAAAIFAFEIWRAREMHQPMPEHTVGGVPLPSADAVEHPAVYAFKGAVALAVGAIPEGLPAAVTITLAIGVARMARRHALIRKLPAVETLGSTTVICSDKTGTLTENQMTVRALFAGGQLAEVTGQGYDPAGQITGEDSVARRQLLTAGLLCNDTHFEVEGGRRKVHGDPTEAALLVAAEKAGLDRAALERAQPRRDVIPFESAHMFMATLHGGAPPVVYLKGALERVLDRCDRQLGADGRELSLDRDAVRQTAEAMAGQGLRVLAFALKPLAQETLAPVDVEGGLVFVGLQGMIDPPRAEAIEAVRNCQTAGIKVKMITGDHAVTAAAVAAQLGIAGTHTNSGRLKVVTGKDLDSVNDEELPALAEDVAVFARVAPEQKLRLVRALQAHQHVVAMTGDGVNDAPALKQADIGVAMGITGTEVAKGAAAMVLTDDNFASIESAVEEGRTVYDNLKKFIAWTLPTNAGQSLILVVAMLLGEQLPITPVQLLWVNLVTAILLGLMLVFEPREAGLMARPPRDPQEPIVTGLLMFRTGLVGLIMLVGGLALFHYELGYEGLSLAQAQTTVVNVVVLTQAFYLLNCRSLSRSFFRLPLMSNPAIWGGIAATVLAQLAMTYWPVFQRLFHTAAIPAVEWARVLALGLATFVMIEFVKSVESYFTKKG